jgi:hypothetical protein
VTDVADERPFYEAAMARRAPQPPASRVPVYLICGAAFIVGFVAFFIGGMPDRPPAMDEALAYMLGYKLGAQAIYAGVIGLAGMVILSLTQARKLRQRSSGEDFLGPFLCALGGGLAAVALVIALGAPAAAANKIANPIRIAHLEATETDAHAFDREAFEISGGGVLSGANLQGDPGYRKASAKIEKLRELVVRQRKLQNDRFAATRRKLAQAIKSEGQRKRILGEFDREVAKARPLLEEYWTLQNQSVDQMATTLAILKASPGQWRNEAYYFTRHGDMTRFRDAQSEGRQIGENAETVRQKLLALAGPQQGRYR